MVATPSSSSTSRHPHAKQEDSAHALPHRQGMQQPTKSDTEGSYQNTGVISRLHALFPTSHELHGDADSAKPVPHSQRARRSRPPSRCLKMRMLTWNMHDSLPKVSFYGASLSFSLTHTSSQGDLQDLLGVVDHDVDVSSISEGGAIPLYPLDTNHPYHLIVV